VGQLEGALRDRGGVGGSAALAGDLDGEFDAVLIKRLFEYRIGADRSVREPSCPRRGFRPPQVAKSRAVGHATSCSPRWREDRTSARVCYGSRRFALRHPLLRCVAPGRSPWVIMLSICFACCIALTNSNWSEDNGRRGSASTNAAWRPDGGSTAIRHSSASSSHTRNARAPDR
jgi:hypothetical protein